MSKKDRAQKKLQVNKKPAMLGDYSAEKKELLFYIVIFAICAVIMFGWVIPKTFQDPEPTPMPATELDITISTAELVEDVQWNIWFTVSSIADSGEVLFTPEQGFILAYDLENEKLLETPLTTIEINEAEKYAFIWFADKEAEQENFLRLDITMENAAIKKESGIYMTYDSEYYQFHSKEAYEERVKKYKELQESEPVQ